MHLSFTITHRDPCPVCGKEVPPERDKYCSYKCAHDARHNVARANARAIHDLEFIGVDGEGVYVNGEHRYVMLSVGDETLWKDGEELTHLDIFPFLWEQFCQHPNAVFVGFYLRYDFTMWLKSLPLAEGTRRGAWGLFTAEGKFTRKQTRQAKKGNPIPDPIFLDGWRIDILGMKRFKIQPDETLQQKIARKKAKQPNPWMFVNDTGGFWQCSFLTAIDPAKWTNGDSPCTVEEYATIQQGKDARNTEVGPGDISYYDDMVRYNTLENRVLGRAMRILNRGFVAEEIVLKRDQFYGPGQAAQAKQDRMFPAKDHWIKRENLKEIIPPDIIDAFKASYYGGWFEAFYVGHVPGTTYEYDIRSAYPDAMRNLPCLCSAGDWSQGSFLNDALPVDSDIALLYGTFRGSDKNCGGLPYRIGKGKGQGRSTHPYVTRGWYLETEIRAAVDAKLIDDWEIERWIAHTSCGHDSPYAFLADMYERRKAVGKNTPHGRALKLALNSMYGKSAQSIGEPKYSNPIYASMITSDCREKMLLAIATHPHGTDHLVMIATDGIYFRTRHPILDEYSTQDILGNWEAGSKHNLTVMKPGVYWDDAARNAPVGVFKVKSRGISAKSLHENLTVLDDAFSEVYTSGDLDQLPTLEMSAPFGFISPAQALARGKWETCGIVRRDVSRQDSARIWPKRRNPYIDGPYIRTECPPPLRKIDSEPYAKDFGFERSLEERNDMDWITEAGTLAETFTIALDVARAGE